MKKTVFAVAACAILASSPLAFAQSATGAGGIGTDNSNGSSGDMSTGRASVPESNNQPGTTAGTPVHSIPSNSLDGSTPTNAGK